ncbi:unnamed protein product [Caenorhabditis angaria]|uniref:Uncharacterized protein n=1 Tax=Caenorhabditis angaria TaxID=860376 RepID=A0A9P1I6Y6_9PELO|nr:unnamed protein product [Caenorhabditis angaria]
MDEGDDYVPQMTQMTDYGMPMGVPPQQQQQQQQQMYQQNIPMSNPYEHQQMMMMQQQQQMQMQQQQQVAPPPAKKGRGKSKKALAAAAAAQQQQQQEMDPMASMAAMSNNPMRGGAGGYGMYPPGSYPGGSAGYPGRPGAPQQQPQPQQQYGYRPGYPPQQPPQGYPGYPQGYPQGSQYPPQQQMRPQQQQYPQGYWDQQQQQQQQQYGYPQASASAQQPQDWQQLKQQLYQIEAEMNKMQHRMNQLFHQPRNPMIDQEVQHLQHRMQYMQKEHYMMTQQMQQVSQAPQSQQVPQAQPQQQTSQQQPYPVPPSSTGSANSQGTPSSSQVVIQPSTPVQVNSTGNQVQLNITSDKTRTLISVYHEGYGGVPGSGASSTESKESVVPPEPTPTTAQIKPEPAYSGSYGGVPSASNNGVENGAKYGGGGYGTGQPQQMYPQQQQYPGQQMPGYPPQHMSQQQSQPYQMHSQQQQMMANNGGPRQPQHQGYPPYPQPPQGYPPMGPPHQQMVPPPQQHQIQQQQIPPPVIAPPGLTTEPPKPYPAHPPMSAERMDLIKLVNQEQNEMAQTILIQPCESLEDALPSRDSLLPPPIETMIDETSQPACEKAQLEDAESDEIGRIMMNPEVGADVEQENSAVSTPSITREEHRPPDENSDSFVQETAENPAENPEEETAETSENVNGNAEIPEEEKPEIPVQNELPEEEEKIVVPNKVEVENEEEAQEIEANIEPEPEPEAEVSAAEVEPEAENIEEPEAKSDISAPVEEKEEEEAPAQVAEPETSEIPAPEEPMEIEQKPEVNTEKPEIEQEEIEEDEETLKIEEPDEAEIAPKEEEAEIEPEAETEALEEEEDEIETKDGSEEPSEEPSAPATPMTTASTTSTTSTSTKKKSTNSSSYKRPAVIVAKAKKKKSVDDSDDDDFYPSKGKGRGRGKKKVAGGEDQANSAETGGVMKRAASGKWADVLNAGPQTDEFDEDDDELLMRQQTSAQTDPDAMIVEKILNSKMQKIEKSEENQEGEEEEEEEIFLIKWKGRAYVHCEWKNAQELEELDKRSVAKVKRYKMKKERAYNEIEDEDFNADYVIVDRVVDVTVEEDGQEFALIKWKSLGYEEVTWEAIETVPAEKVELWRSRQIIDPAKLKEKARPEPDGWKKIANTTVWKNDNSLREYQFEGVNWLLYCYYNSQNCILADEMGLGKTVQTITFLSEIYKYGIHGPFLIVVPLSTIHNWVREFETWTDMNAVVYHGSSYARDVLQQYEVYYDKKHSANKQWRKNLVKLDALITTFEMVVTDCEFIKKIPWRVCVIDEAHRLKNRNCKLLVNGLLAFRMEHRVLLTGTPLQNNIEELFSLLNFLCPQQFHSSAEFLEEFGSCKSDEQVQKLQEILRPMMLRRLKEDVEKSLGPKEETIIEVQLSDMQKKFYRAILERNFTHLCKGTNAPSLMNVMMELRKCCNHPFLINGAEETILNDFKMMHPEWDDETLMNRALVQASGKVVLIEKLLPKLRKDGHKVLIFSQMVKVLDLLEEFLVNMSYPFERIDGNVRGDLRQASIDRFSRENSDRFVFLLCTRAGGLGINLTAADTVIIFDSDWNPQNDLQAQARCHRIGQKKLVKVYRLITANTYEREMFDKASLKLGLDKAVLQSTTALKESSTALSKKDVEELLKKGAYGSIMDENNESSKFNEEDIETILQRRTQTITLEAGQKGSLFAKATFNSTHNKGDDIDIDDPEFWNKWAEKAQVDLEKMMEKTPDGRELILEEPRKRTKRFEDNMKDDEESDGSDEGNGKNRRRTTGGPGDRTRKRRRDDEDGDYSSHYRPDELATSKQEYFKVEKVLAQYGWGRWAEMKKMGELEISELDIEHMCRTLILHCIREFRGDDRIRSFLFALIKPERCGDVPKQQTGSMQSIYHQGWAALPEFNPPSFALDSSFQRHVHRHANKLLIKVDMLKHLEKYIIADAKDKCADVTVKFTDIELKELPQIAEVLIDGWDSDCDKCLLIGSWRHGLENYDAIKSDENLCFKEREALIATWPASAELWLRFRRLVGTSQRNIHDPVYERLKWTKREEQEFMRILRSFGIKDSKTDSQKIDWDSFRSFSPLLEKKNNEEMQEQLFCVLAMCTKAQGGELGPMDLKRAMSVEPMSSKRSFRLMNRLHLTRKVHALAASLDAPAMKLCAMDGMPAGWTHQHDKELMEICDQYGIDGLATHCLRKPAFEKIVRPSERTLLRRVLEIVNTVEHGKWMGAGDVDSLEESDTEDKRDLAAAQAQAIRLAQQQQATAAAAAAAAAAARRGRKRGAGASSSGDAEAAKMRAVMQQMLLASGGGGTQQDLAAAALLQTLMMPQLMGMAASTSSASSQAAQQQQQSAAAAQLLAHMFMGSMPSTSSGGASSSKSAANALAQAAAASSSADAMTMQQQLALAEILAAAAAAGNMATPQIPPQKKKPAAATPKANPAEMTKAQQESMVVQYLNNAGVGMNELVILNALPKETQIPMMHKKTPWLMSNPEYVIDLNNQGKKAKSGAVASSSAQESTSQASSAKPSAPATPAPVMTPKSTSPKLAQEEKKATVTANVKASNSLQIDDPIAVFNRNTGELLAASKWPKAKDLSNWLDANSEFNVHTSSSAIAQLVLGSTERIGGEGATTISTTQPSTTHTPAPPLTPSTPASMSAATTAQLAALAAAAASTSANTTTATPKSSRTTADSLAKQQMDMLQMQLLLQQAALQQSMQAMMFPYGVNATTASGSGGAGGSGANKSTTSTTATTSTPSASAPSTSNSGASTSAANQNASTSSNSAAANSSADDQMNPMLMQALMSNPVLFNSLLLGGDPTAAMLLAAAQMPQTPQSSKKSKH